MVGEGKHVKHVLAAVGITYSTWFRWRDETPQRAAMYARAQEGYAENLVLGCPVVAADPLIDPKARRVIVDTNLRVAALLCPQRFSQAALDRLTAPPEEEERVTPDQIVQALLNALNVGGRAALPAPVEGEWAEVDDDL
jgi:hypothetical protein